MGCFRNGRAINRRKVKRTYFRCLIAAVLSLIFLFAVITTVSDVFTFERHAAVSVGRPAHWKDPSSICVVSRKSFANVSTSETFPSLGFQEDWIKTSNWWDAEFERKFHQMKAEQKNRTITVILVPHSHNDPGWLKTYEEYYQQYTEKILDNMVAYLNKNEYATFIWAEVSYLAKWWAKSSQKNKNSILRLLKSKRLEITGGGWVMVDEATVSLYSMVHQLIEGHQWVKHHLNISPKTSWSIDPFGHGATLPYLLKSSGIGHMVIQRVHYAWKKWFAANRCGDFTWKQAWDERGKHDMLCHNMPYDIYSIKHSCGPFRNVCLSYDFRKLPFELTEYGMISVPISKFNVKNKAEELLRQFERTSVLFPHGAILMPIGNDFRYDQKIEWHQQLGNFKTLVDFLQRNSYGVNISFGTVADYFDHLEASQFRPNLSIVGDFMPYSDVMDNSVPSYWTGYYTTRPYLKAFSREVEHHLRIADILYALAVTSYEEDERLSQVYAVLNEARSTLALFQHHDAITGTSKAAVMDDYGQMLHRSLNVARKIQTVSSLFLLANDSLIARNENLIWSDGERKGYDYFPFSKPLTVLKGDVQEIVIFNSHPHFREEVIRLVVKTTSVKITDMRGKDIPFQINPLWNLHHGNLTILDSQFELFFIAKLLPLGFSTFLLTYSSAPSVTTIYSNHVKLSEEMMIQFPLEPISRRSVKLENCCLKLSLSTETGLLQWIQDKETGRSISCELKFAAYKSKSGSSGAYLFKPASESGSDAFNSSAPRLFITAGSIFTEMSVVYGDALIYAIRIYNEGDAASRGIYIETLMDVSGDIRFLDKEFVMRFLTDMDASRIYTDSNGFQMLERKFVPSIGPEGNYYPVTNALYIENEDARLNLLVSRAHGSAVWNTGILEVMLDRRTVIDDNRGMGEGVLDQIRTLSKFWLVPEVKSSKNSRDEMNPRSNATFIVERRDEKDELPNLSLLANYLSGSLNYPPLVLMKASGYEARTDLSFLNKPFPCDVQLLSMRSLSRSRDFSLPSKSALVTLHRQGYSCAYFGSSLRECRLRSDDKLDPGTAFTEHKIKSVQSVTLTGLHILETLNSIHDVRLPRQELTSLNITFV